MQSLVGALSQLLACFFAIRLPPGAAAAGGGDSVKVEELRRITAGDAATNDLLAQSVALSGSVIAIGASSKDDPRIDSGVVYVFEDGGDQRWSQQARLTVPGGRAHRRFGQALALEGSTLAVGAPGNGCAGGAVHLFRRDGGTWGHTATLIPSDALACDQFGYSVALEGDTLVAGSHLADTSAFDAGAAYVFTRGQDGLWSETAKLLSPFGFIDETFGGVVAIGGDRIVVAADNFAAQVRQGGSVYVFERGSNGTWALVTQLFPHDSRPHDYFGSHLAMGADRIIVGAVLQDGHHLPQTGAVYVFARNANGVWVEEAKLAPKHMPSSPGTFGCVSLDGDLLAVGNPSDFFGGAVYLFRRSAREWSEIERIGPSVLNFRPHFGSDVVLRQGLLVVGAPGDDEGALDAGAAYVLSVREYQLRRR